VNRSFSIFCGKGNNGGDGLAIARMLAGKGCEVNVHILEFGHKGTEDFQQNLARLHGLPVNIRFVQADASLPAIPSEDIIIDSLLGSGLNRPLEGVTAALVEHLNTSGNAIVAIDIPSGLFVDKSSRGNTIVQGHYTLAFQCYKPALLVAENDPYIGQVHIIDIGLHPGFLEQIDPAYYWIDAAVAKSIYKPRRRFSHKGTYGHALLVAGSYGKLGAAVLSARACLRSGVGLLTVQTPEPGMQVMQTAVPEAMWTPHTDDLSSFTVIGLGPGLGREEATAHMLEKLLRQFRKPVVLDADALNIISEKKALLQQVPPYAVLTPHPKEFERLFGKAANDFERIELAKTASATHQVIIVLKGQHTFIATPSGKCWFNSSGNAGMATGGTGDVLTGIITGLMAQGYTPEQAAVFGVYWHGLAGDIASVYHTPESMIASDIPVALGAALQQISANPKS
jgi:ADP-dependent NAD(P)H-hydrate dehydratase / NAD(P)H-hydrate epimerase